MTSVDQRMADALSDLDAILTEGATPENAIAACAAEYGFRPEVLKLRAEKVLGDLSSLRERNLRRSEVLVREHRADTAINRYLTENPEANFPDWFEAEVGRPATKAEQDDFTERYLKFLVSKMHFEI